MSGVPGWQNMKIPLYQYELTRFVHDQILGRGVIQEHYIIVVGGANMSLGSLGSFKYLIGHSGYNGYQGYQGGLLLGCDNNFAYS